MAFVGCACGGSSEHADVFEHIDQLWDFDSVQSSDRNYAHPPCTSWGSRTVGEVEFLARQGDVITAAPRVAGLAEKT
jgi:hypothetical protein